MQILNDDIRQWAVWELHLAFVKPKMKTIINFISNYLLTFCLCFANPFISSRPTIITVNLDWFLQMWRSQIGSAIEFDWFFVRNWRFGMAILFGIIRFYYLWHNHIELMRPPNIWEAKNCLAMASRVRIYWSNHLTWFIWNTYELNNLYARFCSGYCVMITGQSIPYVKITDMVIVYQYGWCRSNTQQWFDERCQHNMCYMLSNHGMIH